MSQKLSVCEAPVGEAEKQSNTCSTQLLTATNGKDRHGWAMSLPPCGGSGRKYTGGSFSQLVTG